MTEFHPYISFPGNGAEAFSFYQSVFGGELQTMSYDEFPADTHSQFPFELPKGALAHATLRGGMIALSGGDNIAPTADCLVSGAYSFLIYCEDLEQARELINTLAGSGGTIVSPVERAPWGQYYGQARDQFDVLWSVNVVE